MLGEFLKSAYKQKSIKHNLISIKNWTITSNSMKRRYSFDTFQQAVSFMSISNNYLTTSSNTKFTVMNVYNSVEIELKEPNNLTTIEVKAAENLNALYWVPEPVQELIDLNTSTNKSRSLSIPSVTKSFYKNSDTYISNENVPTDYRLENSSSNGSSMFFEE